MKEITFYYDIVCPFAYVASRLIERLAERNAASIRWAPVLLGELIDPLIKCNCKCSVCAGGFEKSGTRGIAPIYSFLYSVISVMFK